MRPECVRRETVFLQVEARRAEPARNTIVEAVGTRTLSAHMQIDHSTIPLSSVPLKTRRMIRRASALLAPLALMMASSSVAQQAMALPSAAPDAPAIILSAPRFVEALEPQPSIGVFSSEESSPSTATLPDEPTRPQVAPIHTKYILPGMTAQPLSSRDKVMIGLQDSYSLMNFGGMLAAAGYEQLRNAEPNYGTDRGAFGERLGAAAIRDTTQGVFTDAVYAPLLHEDPRYYAEGPQYSTIHRALYAVTRPLITRTDSGHKTLNGALLLGYASSSLLNNAYYPAINRNAHDTAIAFGGSLGGSALGFLLSEFSSSLWHKVHLTRNQ